MPFNSTFYDTGLVQDKENMKSLLEYIQKNIKKNDVIFISHFSQYSFKYYAKEYGFNSDFELPNNWSLAPYFRKNFFKLERWHQKKGYNTLFISKASVYTTTNRRRVDYELNLLKGYKRVWVILRNDHSYYDYRLHRQLMKHGKELAFIPFPGREGYGNILYFYDFSKSEIINKSKDHKLLKFFKKVLRKR